MLRSVRLLLLAGSLLSSALAADDAWHTLFDGKTFANWVDPTKKSPPGDSFVIEDGCLKAVSHPRYTEDLFTTEKFRDFELEFDWKISPRGNSGVKYRIQDTVWVHRGGDVRKFEDMVRYSMEHPLNERPARGQDYVIGFEYQITDNAANPDAMQNGPRHRTAALYDMIAASQDVTKPVGEFNHSRIVVKGDHIEHWLNGVKVVDASLKDPSIAAGVEKRWGKDSPVYNLLVNQPRQECPISLQNHGDECWFKNIRVRRL
jgi:hypothetical protein